MRNVSLLWIKSLLVNAHSHHIHSIHPSTAKEKHDCGKSTNMSLSLTAVQLDDPVGNNAVTVVLGVK